MAHGSEFNADRDRHPDSPVLHKDLRDGLPKLTPGNSRMARSIAEFQREQDAQQNPNKQVKAAHTSARNEAVGEPGTMAQTLAVGVPDPPQPAPPFALDGAHIKVRPKHQSGKDKTRHDQKGIPPVISCDDGDQPNPGNAPQRNAIVGLSRGHGGNGKVEELFRF